MAVIDITKKAPDVPEKNFKNSVKKFLFYFVQWTWGLPVNIVGAVMFSFCTKVKKRRWQRFGYSYIVYRIPAMSTKWKKASSMRWFILSAGISKSLSRMYVRRELPQSLFP